MKSHKLDKNGHLFHTIGIAHLLYLLLGELAGLAIWFLLSHITTIKDVDTLSTIIALYGLTFPLILMYLGAPPSRSTNVQRPSPIATFILAFGALYIFNYLTTLLISFLEWGYSVTFYHPVDTLLEGTTLLVMIRVCILAPIGEELLCRWAVLGKLAPYGRWFAVTTSALLFALIHGNLFQFFYAFGVGMVLGDFVYRGGKIWQAIVIHALLNGSSLWWSTPLGTLLGPYIVVGGIFFALILLPRWWPDLYKSRNQKPRWSIIFWCTPEVICFLCLTIINGIFSLSFS